MEDMGDVIRSFPERLQELVRHLFSYDIDYVLENLDELKCGISTSINAMTIKEFDKVFNCALGLIYKNSARKRWKVSHCIILFFFILDDKWSSWCMRDPDGFLSGARHLTEIAAELANRSTMWSSALKEQVHHRLNRVLLCHVHNMHCLKRLSGQEKLRYSTDAVLFFGSCSYSLPFLFSRHPDSIKWVVSVLSLKGNIEWEDRDAFERDCQNYIQLQWSRYRSRLLGTWKEVLGGRKQDVNLSPVEYLKSFYPAWDDTEWLEWFVDEFSKCCSVSNGFSARSFYEWRSCLGIFRCWTGAAVRQLFQVSSDIKEVITPEAAKNILSSHSALSPQDRAWFGLALLMCERTSLIKGRERPSESSIEAFEEVKSLVGSIDGGDVLHEVFTHLQDLPTGHYDQPGIWNEFGPDEIAAWRSSLASLLSDQISIRYGLIEYLLWHIRSKSQGSSIYSDMELVILSLCTNGKDIEFVKGLTTHCSRLVCVRAQALLPKLDQASRSAVVDSLPEDGVTLAAANQTLAALGNVKLPYRTWLQNESIERVIYTTIREVEQVFAMEYESQWRLDEEVHLATLLSRLENAFKDTRSILNSFSVNGVGIAPVIKFSFRQIPKKEEGAAGIGHRRFSVDVAFIINVTDAGKTVSQRAVLVQCKKLNTDNKGVWAKSFKYDGSQCDDLLKQTESSFYMFLSPSFIEREVWMTPARLVRNLATIGGHASVLPKAPIYFASRSLAHWLTYDLMGLWTGDERRDVLDKARGRDLGCDPRFVVTISIHRNATENEGGRFKGIEV